jgi:HK97 family phage portal protein
MRSAAGVRIDHRTALFLPAVLRATRVLSETISSLPLNLIVRGSDGMRRVATEHPVYRLFRRGPNPEQDSMAFLDQLVAWQINSGTAYAEIQRRQDGEIVALWPIHPTRIPRTNIVRNPRSGPRPIVGAPGEVVFYVRNNDGSTSPVPASQMLVVPGAQSEDGITGRGLIDLGLEALGIAKAVETHAASFFRNGAVPGILLNYEGALSPEKQDKLREMWEQRYEGADKHYKTVILAGAKATAQVLGVDPEKTQLLESRQFSIAEVSRIWGVPLHMLSDLSRATWSNIESQAIDFVTYSLRPWIERWERAMNRQLLTPEERETHYFKFNLNALLRGDSGSRASFYQTMQSMGVYSINEIRELEDLDPIPEGDVRLIPANNMKPLEDVAIAAARQIFENLIKHEIRRVNQAAKHPREFAKWMEDFYGTTFSALIEREVEPVASMAARIGRAVTARDIAADHCRESRDMLAEVLDCQESELAAAVAAVTSAWPSRADAMARRYLGRRCDD